MFTKPNSNKGRIARIRRIRAKVIGTAERPRLAVFRSLTHISAQLIDDATSKSLGSVSDKGLTGTPTEKAKRVGQKIAEVAKTLKITSVVYDRAGYKYHGRVAALAEGAREAGLQF